MDLTKRTVHKALVLVLIPRQPHQYPRARDDTKAGLGSGIRKEAFLQLRIGDTHIPHRRFAYFSRPTVGTAEPNERPSRTLGDLHTPGHSRV